MGSSETGEGSQVFKGGQIMVAGTTDPLDPLPLSKSLRRGE